VVCTVSPGLSHGWHDRWRRLGLLGGIRGSIATMLCDHKDFPVPMALVMAVTEFTSVL